MMKRNKVIDDIVIPAQAGIQGGEGEARSLDSRLRGNDVRKQTRRLMLASALSMLIAALVPFHARAQTANDEAGAPKPLIGDVARGRKVFFQCRTCHYPEKAYGNHNGPNLYGVFGRKAGTREGYEHYSDVMKNAGFVWTPQLLDFWLAHPDTFLPDSSMIVFTTTAQERADLIAYLQTFHD